MRPAWRILVAWLASCVALAGAASAAPTSRHALPPLGLVTLFGPTTTVFASRRDACDGDDVPDTPARAFRAADGSVVLLAMHTLNRALRGPSLAELRIDCRSPLRSAGDADPARYDDASWIAATWTEDGRRVEALLHHEYQANTHPDRCRIKDYLACWYNSVVAVRSEDGGLSFSRPDPPQVVATAPFRQEIGQGRHRGFFNPSNIVADGAARLFLSSTTGWEGQGAGACLFRTTTPDDASSWRAFDGEGFTVRYADPYRSDEKPRPCLPLAPFPGSVGAVVRHRGTGVWLAVFQAKADGRLFPQPGFYTATSRDLLRWDAPHLLLAGHTLYDDPCGSGGQLVAYPSLLDPAAGGRNFDDVGDTADLFYARLRVEGCRVTSDRDLVRRRVAIRIFP